MGLFSPNLNGMGPDGYQAREPRGKLGRFFQIMSQDGRGIMASGLLAGLSSSVYILSMALALKYQALIFMLIGAPLGGLVVMPQLLGVADTVFRAMRHEAGFWWMRYKMAWKRNLRISIPAGLLMGFIFGFQLLILRQAGIEGEGVVLSVAMLVCIALCTAIAKWTVLQLAIVELPFPRIVINSVLLCGRFPLKSIGTTLFEYVYWVLIVSLVPVSLVFAVILNFWFPMLVTMLYLYQPLNETFGIEDALGRDNMKKSVPETGGEDRG